jgi:hypothetical protein
MHEGEGRRVISARNSVPELDAWACSGVRESYDDQAIPESGGILGIDATRDQTEMWSIPGICSN